MIHISKSSKTGKFHVGVVADARNQELLASSEGVAHRSNAIKNIRAQMKVFDTSLVRVQDNTGKVIKLILLSCDSQIILNSDLHTLQKPYVPGQ